MSRSQGIEEMPLRALRQLRITDLSEQFVAAAFLSPTLRAALASFRQFVPFEDSYLDFWISSGETTVKLCISNRFPLDQEGLRYEDWNELLVLLAIVQAFAGPAWYPHEMAFRSNVPLSRFAAEQFPNTRLLVGQQCAWITLPHDLLNLSPHARSAVSDIPLTAKSSPLSGQEPIGDLPDSLKRLLAAYLGDGCPSIQLAAELAGTSVRTLQRKLQQCRISYSDLVKNARVGLASTLLRNTDRKIIDIAHELGYQDPAHFTRAFGRLAGVNPREYRRQHRSH